jgi:hypothetical protein
VDIQELVDENRELRETLFAIREMISDALSVETPIAGGDGINGEDDEEFED